LSKKGPKKAIEISKEESIPRTETYHLLSTLEAKGIVSVSIQRPTSFSAVKIEQAIESIINSQQEKIEELKILKHDMIELWNSFQNIRQNNKSDVSKFESRMKKYSKSSRVKTNFKRNLKEMRRKSDMFDN
jgi:sugar-specific transcriptional regulator TrmB